MRTHVCDKIIQEKWKRGFGIFLCGSCAALLFWIPAIGSTFLGFANCCLSSSISRRRERGLELNIAIACLRNCAQWCRTTSLDSSLSIIGYKVLPHVWNERASHAIFSGTAGNAEQRLFRFFEIPFTRFMKLSKIEGQSFSSLWSKLYSSTDTYYKPLCLLSDNNRKWFFCGTFSSMERGTPTGNNRKTFSASKSVLHAIIDHDLREANWNCCTTVCILFSFLDRIPNWSKLHCILFSLFLTECQFG
jgi:hypothetical protein